MPKITFKYQNGKTVTVQGKKNLSVLEIAHKNGVDLEGACEGSLACSTCHVIVEPYVRFCIELNSYLKTRMSDNSYGKVRWTSCAYS